MDVPVEFKVYRDRFLSTEEKLGVITYNGEQFDYGHLDVSACEAVKGILESAITVPVGFSKRDGYGKHSVVEESFEPHTAGQLAAVTNRRLDDGLFIEVDTMNKLF